MAWTGCRNYRLLLVFGSWWTCDDKSSSEFERAAAMMHRSSSWMFGEEEGFFRDLTGRNSGRRTSGCGQAVRSGSGGELSSDESEFLRKRTPKENRE
jgi:hypothetical protein